MGTISYGLKWPLNGKKGSRERSWFSLLILILLWFIWQVSRWRRDKKQKSRTLKLSSLHVLSHRGFEERMIEEKSGEGREKTPKQGEMQRFRLVDTTARGCASATVLTSSLGLCWVGWGGREKVRTGTVCFGWAEENKRLLKEMWFCIHKQYQEFSLHSKHLNKIVSFWYF